MRFYLLVMLFQDDDGGILRASFNVIHRMVDNEQYFLFNYIFRM
jgi:hypothetical protein